MIRCIYDRDSKCFDVDRMLNGCYIGEYPNGGFCPVAGLELDMNCLCCGWDGILLVKYHPRRFFGSWVLIYERVCPQCGAWW